MKIRARGVRLIAAMMMIVCLLFGAATAFAAADPVRVSSLSEPQSVISEQEVSITIKVYNSSQEDLTGDIILYDPTGAPLETYSGLKGENSVTYTGTWNVTQEQIDKSKINYYIRYTVDTENGPTETTRTIPVTIQTEAAAPQLTATYSVTPTAAKEGQEVTLSYTLSNTGNVELRNIVIENAGVTKKDVTAVSLSVGEKVTLTDTFTMGSKEVVSKPQITYTAAGSKKSLTISDMAKKTITVAEDGLEIVLSAKNTENLYPGEEVAFELKMKNSGNTAYTGLSVLLEDGTAVATGVELAPGASYEGKFTKSFTESATVSVSATGKDSSGNDIAVDSGAVTVTTQDISRALILDVAAQAETTVIHSEPAVVRFAVLVKNTGETDATNLSVTQNGTTVATIPSLPSGESRTLVFDLQTSIAGKFRFDVSGKDADGNSKTYASNVIEVGYVAPTPAPTKVPPTPTPKPTATPAPTATPVPTLSEMIAQKVNPTVLYAIAGVLGALLVIILAASGVSSAKRNKRLKGALDTIELSPDVRNHRGVKKGKKAKKQPAPKAEDKPIVPAEELENEPAKTESMTPARDALRRAQTEEVRRRRPAVQVGSEETLRVAPVDERPEFVAQGKVDDSQTRVFGRLTQNDEAAAEAGDTIRFDRASVEEVKRREEAAAKSAKGQKRSEIKPMKKKKKGGLFGKKMEDDLIDENDDLADGEDDFFE